MRESYLQFLNRKGMKAGASLYFSGIMTGYLLSNGVGIYEDPLTWATTGAFGLGGAVGIYRVVKAKKEEYLPFWYK